MFEVYVTMFLDRVSGLLMFVLIWTLICKLSFHSPGLLLKIRIYSYLVFLIVVSYRLLFKFYIINGRSC